jgi:hypothetical protein
MGVLDDMVDGSIDDLDKPHSRIGRPHRTHKRVSSIAFVIIQCGVTVFEQSLQLPPDAARAQRLPLHGMVSPSRTAGARQQGGKTHSIYATDVGNGRHHLDDTFRQQLVAFHHKAARRNYSPRVGWSRADCLGGG